MRFITAVALVCVTVGVQAATVNTAPTLDQVRQAQQTMAAENAMNVGKVLPFGTEVLQHDNERVDLRSVQHGRTILVKIKPGCPPCERMLTFIRTNAASFVKAQNADIVILMVDSAKAPKLTMPSDVTVLHTASAMVAGFLGGSLTPTVFFFDANHTLIARSAGLVGSPKGSLRFPEVVAPQ